MALLRFPMSEKYLRLAREIAEYSGGIVIEEPNRIVVQGRRLTVLRRMFDEIFCREHSGECEALWRSLVSSREGSLVNMDSHLIVVEDETGAVWSRWPTIRVKAELRDLVKLWSDRLGMPMSELVELAVRDYIDRLEERLKNT